MPEVPIYIAISWLHEISAFSNLQICVSSKVKYRLRDSAWSHWEVLVFIEIRGSGSQVRISKWILESRTIAQDSQLATFKKTKVNGSQLPAMYIATSGILLTAVTADLRHSVYQNQKRAEHRNTTLDLKYCTKNDSECKYNFWCVYLHQLVIKVIE